ncbi:MAG: phenylpyruvate tautomerase MIF-related protein [Gammaproteobacteria bacterium]|nr:phenylpyruvate tautomerase MIF-related protein [Gammaproteobacteria bacterium]
MPLLSIETNQTLDDAQLASLLSSASARTAEILGKPESYVMVRLSNNPNMMFGGNQQPLAYVELKSLGLPEDQTAEFSASLCDLLTTQMDVPADRIYIEFKNGARHLWGWNGATF